MPDLPPGSSTDRARMPLLALITQESMDEDYQHVADRRAELSVPTPTGRRPHWVAACVVAAFGVLVAVAAVQTSASSGVNAASRESLMDKAAAERLTAADLQRRIVRLRENNGDQQQRAEDLQDQVRSAESRAENIGARSGFVPVSGPGVVITVDDAPDGEAVRGDDLALLVNGLWAAGAEAIAINGKRLNARSAIFNSGAAINLNGPPPLSPPYVVSAIGNKNTLQADLLDTSTGLQFSSTADALGFSVKRQNVDDLTLPAATLREPRHAVEGTAEENRTNHGKGENAP
jgi:uncharacterized protein YlxW (UPF0749 family)